MSEHRATVPHAATLWELCSFLPKGWGASPDKRRSINMRKIAIGLVVVAIATGASTLSASAFRGGFGGAHFGGGGFARPAFGGGGFGRGGFGGPGRFMG